MKSTLWAAILFFSPSLVLAQQPFATDDADTTPGGKVHVEVFDEYDWLQRGQAPHLKQNTINMKINYGLTNRLELDLDAPLITIINQSTASVRRTAGFGDTNFGVKYNFRSENGRSPAVSGAVYIETPTGDPVNGLGSGLTDIWVYGIVQKQVSPPLVMRLNGGYLFTGNTSTGVVGITTARGHVATIGGSLVRRFTRELDLGVEITAAAASNTDIQRGQLQVLVGGNYAIRQGLTLDIGVVRGRFIASPHYGLQIGFALDYR